MPYYSYVCENCGAMKGDVRTIEERHDGPYCYCGAPGQMKLVIDPVRGIVKNPAAPRKGEGTS